MLTTANSGADSAKSGCHSSAVIVMPAALAVDRETAKTLCVAVGVREAARQMGIPEATMQAWSARGKWFVRVPDPIQPAIPPTILRQTGPNSLATDATSASKHLQNALESRKTKSRLLLSKYVVNASKVASRSRSPLKDAQNVRHVAAVHSAIWPEAPGSSSMQLNLGVIVNTAQ